MKDQSKGEAKGSPKNKKSAKHLFSSKAQRLAEKEYEEYYNRIRQLSRGI